ncbi:hypothetical protein [Roseomonas rosulenta]|uniref:hypothetical protein n=1 Tax=Roseomonas rosulenta TaxID=2748667 RepID=UPI0018DFE8D1|nr:hypothetical protein [Roseomonas rosulenta]
MLHHDIADLQHAQRCIERLSGHREILDLAAEQRGREGIGIAVATNTGGRVLANRPQHRSISSDPGFGKTPRR